VRIGSGHICNRPISGHICNRPNMASVGTALPHHVTQLTRLDLRAHRTDSGGSRVRKAGQGPAVGHLVKPGSQPVRLPGGMPVSAARSVPLTAADPNWRGHSGEVAPTRVKLPRGVAGCGIM